MYLDAVALDSQSHEKNGLICPSGCGKHITQ